METIALFSKGNSPITSVNLVSSVTMSQMQTGVSTREFGSKTLGSWALSTVHVTQFMKGHLLTR